MPVSSLKDKEKKTYKQNRYHPVGMIPGQMIDAPINVFMNNHQKLNMSPKISRLVIMYFAKGVVLV